MSAAQVAPPYAVLAAAVAGLVKVADWSVQGDSRSAAELLLLAASAAYSRLDLSDVATVATMKAALDDGPGVVANLLERARLFEDQPQGGLLN